MPTTTTPAVEATKRITSALSTILIGVVLLLNSTGYLSWTVWFELLQFWPVFIITAGISIMLSFNQTGKAIAEVINLLIFAALISLAAVNTYTGVLKGGQVLTPASDNSLNMQSAVIKDSEYPDKTNLDFNLEQKLGSLTINSTTTDNNLLNTTMNSGTNSAGFELSKTIKKDSLQVNMESAVDSFPFFVNHQYSTVTNITNKWKNIYLDLKLGAGETLVNLTDNSAYREVKVDTGAGKTTINIEPGVVAQEIQIHTGVGSVKINLPKEVGYDIEYNVGIGSAKLDGLKNYSSSGVIHGAGKSDNYDSANTKLSINVDIGVGEFILQQK